MMFQVDFTSRVSCLILRLNLQVDCEGRYYSTSLQSSLLDRFTSWVYGSSFWANFMGKVYGSTLLVMFTGLVYFLGFVLTFPSKFTNRVYKSGFTIRLG